MKTKFTDLHVGSCFLQGGRMRKKVAEGKVAVVRANGRVVTKKVKGDPEVEPSPCEIRYLGVGLRRNPEAVVEIGDGNLLSGARATRRRR